MGLVVERLPGERSAHAIVAANAGPCCCCCCCCLHSVGGLIGAISAPAPRPAVPEPPAMAVGTRVLVPSYSARPAYWTVLFVLSALIVSVPQLIGGRDNDYWSLWLAIFLPGLQLVASVIAVFVIAMSRRQGQLERLKHLGSITVRGVLGAMLGGVVMWILFVVVSAR